MTDATVTTETARFETASITTLRHALLADADIHDNRAETYSGAEDGTALAAWCGLLLAASHNRMSAALLGLLSDPRVPADLAERGRYLVGQVLAGWPEVLEGANDDLPDAPAPQVEGQGEIPLTGQQASAAEGETPREFRVGDLVQITGRGEGFDGKTGVVTEIDEGDVEFPIGLTIDGFAGLAWCDPSEIRHADQAAAESGAVS